MTSSPRPYISALKIENFKSIEHADLEFGPLTVLVGANSAGKSSVLQALVLLSQIVRERAQSGLVNLNGAELQLGTFADIRHSLSSKRRVAFSVDLYSPDDLVRPWRMPTARFQDDAGSSEEVLTWRIALTPPDSGQMGSARVRQVELETMRPEGTVRGVFKPTQTRDRAVEAANQRDRIRQFRKEFGFTRNIAASKFFDAQMKVPFSFRRGRPFDVDVAEHAHPGGKYYAIVDHGLPREIFKIAPDSRALVSIWVNGVELQLIETVDSQVRQTSEKPVAFKRPTPKEIAEAANLLFPTFRLWIKEFDAGASPKPVLPQFELTAFAELVPSQYRGMSEVELRDKGVLGPLRQRLLRELTQRLDGERDLHEMLVPDRSQLNELVWDLRERMAAVSYLGPLREDPSPAYRPGQGGGSARLGLKGEYTVPALERFGATKIEVMLPPGAEEQDGSPLNAAAGTMAEMRQPISTVTLKEAVDLWMEYLGVASAVRVRETGRAGIELGIIDSQTGSERSLTDVGVGVSQLLPVVVMCLQAQRGDVVLIEQPELHLHPAPQQALGDFLLAMSMSGRQIIVETHSEYLINRLRFRIAEDDTETVTDLVKIVYAERKNGRTEFRSIKPNAYGSFDDWPADFFDQAPKETEAILRAAMAKRKRQRAQAGRDGTE